MAGKKPPTVEEEIYRKILDSGKKEQKKLAPPKLKRRKYVTTGEKLTTAFISAIILLFTFGAVYYYNLFVDMQYDIEANVAQIETQLQKRKNLIINLGKTVLEYSKHEKEIFTHLAELRALVAGAAALGQNELDSQDGQDPTQTAALPDINMDEIRGGLSNLMAVSEQYPDLKLSENFRTFMDAILDFEKTIADLRMEYNDSINLYSTIRDQIPGYVYAFMFDTPDYSYFQIDEDAKAFIEVK